MDAIMKHKVCRNRKN